MIEFRGKIASITKHARDAGVAYRLVIDRLNRGWDAERAFTLPAVPQDTPRGRLFTFRGETKGISQLARESGLVLETIQYRLARGWGIERALLTPVHKAREIVEAGPRPSQLPPQAA